MSPVASRPWSPWTRLAGAVRGRLRRTFVAVQMALMGVVGSAAPVESAKGFWAYRPIRRPSVPEVRDAAWSANGVDRFVRARMEQAGLEPVAEADRATLCRRVTFDLTGLPPTPGAIDAFLADSRPDAFERLVDDLLASPSFGEHWARHWFDVVRFAESVTLRGLVFKEAWRYRDYVIRAFDEDRPVDRFLREQLAGDLLPADSLEERQRQWVATTFLTLGNSNLEEQDKKQLEMDVVDEQLDVIGKALLGQTVSCARCHDHKFDPIPTRDYYALAGILKNSLAIRHDNVSAWVERPLPLDAATEASHSRRDEVVAAIRAEIKATPKSETSTVEALEVRLREALASLSPRPMVMAPREATGATDLAVHRRGSVHHLGEGVPRGFLEVATPPNQPRPGPTESGRRELADWIVSPENPLTRRVFVNRVWLWLTGRGLVRTADNFGTTGEMPTHPELLDALASAFGGDTPPTPEFARIRPWSVKSLIREIVLSRTYRLDSEPSDAARRVDPENRFRSHANRRRLTAEQLRDALLWVGGRLRQERPVGATFPSDRTADYGFEDSQPYRSVYVPVFRNALPEIFRVFDFPMASLVTGDRGESTVATQALFLLNDPFVREQAAAARGRLPAVREANPDTAADGDSGGDTARAIDAACRWTLGRRPSSGETRAIRTHLASVDDAGEAWTEVMHGLIASPDFRILR